MLSFGAVAFKDGKINRTFTRNLNFLPGAVSDPKTTEFWNKNVDAYYKTRIDCVDPGRAMGDFFNWLKSLDGRPVFAAFPAGFDFTFIYWYFNHFLGRAPEFSCFDLKTYAATILDSPYYFAKKKNFPKEWFTYSPSVRPGNPNKIPHAHIALDDAIEQGEMFMRMKEWAKKKGSNVSNVSGEKS